MHQTLASSLLASKKAGKLLAPVDHGAKIRIQFFTLRLERSGLYNPQSVFEWQPIVDEHMKDKPTKNAKIMFKEQDWDSGFSDG